MIIGGIGSAVITASSLYVALKLGALPWPIVFAALISIFLLKILGKTSLNEANVTHTAMSAGAMVAGGLAFTIPGYWMLGGEVEVKFWQVLVVALSGVVMGLVATACMRRYFIDEAKLPYPIGVSAAEALKASDETAAKESLTLFISMALAAAYTFIRDGLKALPAMFFDKVNIPGVAFGIYNSPMMFAVGFIVGPVACLVWFIGALIGDIGVVVGGTSFGLWGLEEAKGIKTSLGIGLMFGAGIGVAAMQILKSVHLSKKGKTQESEARGNTHTRKYMVRLAPFVSAAVAAVTAWGLGLGLVPSVILILGIWIAVLMSSQCVGVSGINPMEVFGVLVLLLVQVFFHDMDMFSLFLVAAIVAVACGLVGDVMNDFKAGAILKTDPREQWIAQAIGGVIGAVVASVVLMALVGAYGTDCFGLDKEFVAAQAAAVAAMVGGIPNMNFFVVGLVVGLLLAVLKLPCMTLGLGVYLPFYLSFTAFLGGLIKLLYDRVTRRSKKSENLGMAAAAGLLGGESLIGVGMALFIMFSTFVGA